MSSRRRVVVTGLGIVCPVGNDLQTAWQQLLAGTSGIARITRFDASAYRCQIAGEVKNFDVTRYVAAKEIRRMDTFIHYGVAASVQAVADSGIKVRDDNRDRIGCIVGSGIGGLPLIEDNHSEAVNRGPRRISPFLIPGAIINMISGNVSIMYGLRGPNFAVVSACTTGLHSIGESARIIERGDADAMLAGGSESTICPLGIGGFASMQALSVRNDDPAAASRPFDRGRDGFVLGEGAGVVVLEEYEQARLRDARIEPGQVSYLNAHGTSTPLGDVNETNAIKGAFGDSARRLVVNSTKSMTGHLLGGAGGVEAVFTALAIYHQISPPTINLTDPDPECDLDYCANTARNLKIDYALKNSFGFGGTNGTLVFGRAP